MYKKVFTASFLFLLAFGISNAQEVMPLYSGDIPNSIPAKNEEYANADGALFKTSEPTLTAYFPDKEKANGTAIILCPGGGYSAVVIKYEGYPNAEKLRDLGYTCFVLKYRVPSDRTMKDKSIGSIQDLQKAIKTVRENAVKWNINPFKIGVMGFSAGGHLVATAGTHFNKSFIENTNGTSLRPDFMILVYPVISMQDALTHKDSRTSLLGENPTQEQINYFSNELQVTEQTPSTFLIHASEDELVKIGNSIAFYEALQKKKVPAGMHIYPIGNHGFPLEPAKSNWFNSCVEWLKENHWDEREPTKITYKNPITIEPIRDPQIIFVNGTYYMTGTSQLDGSITKIGPGVKLYSSKNLTDWKFVKVLIKPDNWYTNRIWAPEIHQINNRFYLTLNAFAGNPVSQGVCIAVADEIDGNYTVLTPDKPFCEGNDSHLFQDDDGKIYLFNSDNGGVALHDNIVSREISLSPLKIISEKRTAIKPGTQNNWDGSPKEGVAIEGPYVIKHDKLYYLFYSAWGRGYEVGYATSTNINGPWKKFKGNPIYGAQSKEIANSHHKAYTQSPDVPFTEVGHGNLFKTSDGQLWLACHAITNGSDPLLTIDPVKFNKKGEVEVNLTWTKQKVDLKKNKSDGGDKTTATYTNPILDINYADPTVIKAPDGFYYAYATNSKVNGKSIHFQVRKSKNLVDWEDLGDALPEKPTWADMDFWAPHVSYDANLKTYFLYYSGESKDESTGKCLGVATSKSPAGPFTDKGSPLLCGESFVNIDPMAFDDPKTAKKLLYWGSGFKSIKVQELTDDRLNFKKNTEPKDVVSILWNEDPNNYQKLIEGAWVAYHNDYYYIYFSGDNCCDENAHYAVMVARSKNAEGPFETYAEATGKPTNVILAKNGTWLAPGHNSVVSDPSGQEWIVYHAIDLKNRKKGRVMLMDKITYKGDWPQIGDGTPSTKAEPRPVVK